MEACPLTLYIRLSNPTKRNLHKINLLFPILKTITLIQVPVTSCIDYCFISYFVHIQSVFHNHQHSDAIIPSLLLKSLQLHIYRTNSLLWYNRFFMFWFFPTIEVSFLTLLLFIFYTAGIFNCFQFPGMFHHIYSFPYGIISLLGMFIDLENTLSFLFIFHFFNVFLDLA